VIIAFFTPLNCNATSAVVGAAGPFFYFANIQGTGGGKDLTPDTWFPAALAEKITRQDIVVDPDEPFEIITFFNSRLGQPGCLTGSGWYYGLDNTEPSNRIDLLAVVLHEFGHGLGFTVGPTSANTGARAQGFPSVWERLMLDLTTGKRWIDMTNAERMASARNNLNLVWAGQKASNSVHSTLDFGTDLIGLNPSSLGTHEATAALFGAPLRGHDRGFVVAPDDGGGVSPLDGCEPFPAGSGTEGQFVLMNRGTCAFVDKVRNAQNAGAAAAIIANNTAGLPILGGADPTIDIPAVGITQALGATLRGLQLPFVDLRRNPGRRAGTTLNLPRLFAPTAFAQGSSVSHWDITTTPNMLMEPFINSDIGFSVKNPDDLSKSLLVDIGW
jgi:hypothetical protein